MRTMEDDSYERIRGMKLRNQKINQLQKQNKEDKKFIMADFGKAKKLQTAHGTMIELQEVVIAEKIVKTYSYYRIVEL